MRSLRGSIALSVETQTKIAKEFGEMSKIAPKIDRRRTSSQRNRLTNFYWEITGLNPSYPFASAFCVVSKISSLLLSRINGRSPAAMEQQPRNPQAPFERPKEARAAINNGITPHKHHSRDR